MTTISSSEDQQRSSGMSGVGSALVSTRIAANILFGSVARTMRKPAIEQAAMPSRNGSAVPL
jgi:hypothetical protein